MIAAVLAFCCGCIVGAVGMAWWFGLRRVRRGGWTK